MRKLLLAMVIGPLLSPAFASPAVRLEVSPPTLNQDLPSASGLGYLDHAYYAVGDDSKWLYRLDRHFSITGKQLIKEYPVGMDGRIVKAAKPDFETMAQFRRGKQNWLMILGSGSKATLREAGFVMTADGKNKQERNLAPLYAQLKTVAGIGELNIEGLLLGQQQAFLLNRGNGGGNLVFAIRQRELVDYMFGHRESVGHIDVYPVKLPVVSGFEAGFVDTH